MQITVKPATKAITTKSWDDWQAFSLDIASQKQTKKPVSTGRTKVLFGTTDDTGKVATRNALVLHLSYIQRDLATPDMLFDRLDRMTPLECVLLIDTNTKNTAGWQATLVLPLDHPLTAEDGDNQQYTLMLKMRLERLRDLGILAQIPRLRRDEWDRWITMPKPNAKIPQLAYYHVGNTPLPLDGVRKAARYTLINTVEPTGMMKDRVTTKHYVTTHSPAEILKRFVTAQPKWLQDPIHQQACLLHLRVAENAGQVRSVQIPQLIQILAGKDDDLRDQLEIDYEHARQTADEQAGLRYFVQESAIGSAEEWLYFTASGQPKVNELKFAQDFISKHPLLISDHIVGKIAYYDTDINHWVFGHSVWETVTAEVDAILGEANAFHMPIHHACLTQLHSVAIKYAKAQMKQQGHSTTSPFATAPQHYIEFDNATYDWREDRFIPNAPEHLQDRYIPRAIKTSDFHKPELTLGWLRGLVGRDEDALTTLVRFIGYAFTRGYPHQVMLIVVGDGGNGKSTLLRYINRLLGDRTSAVSWHDLTNDTDRFSAMQLVGQYANVAGEMNTVKSQAVQRLKNLTGGDKIKVEEKGQPAISVRNDAKLFFATNQLPGINDYTLGFRRRIRIINLPVNFETTDLSQRNKIDAFNTKYSKDKIDAEMDDFTLYAIREYVKATQAKNHADPFIFPESEAMETAKTQWIATSDSAGTFIRTYLTFSKDAEANQDGDLMKYIYFLYAYATKEAGGRPLVRLRLARRIEKHFGAQQVVTKRRGQRSSRLPGVILNDQAIYDLKNEVSNENVSWRDKLYGYDAWHKKHPDLI